MVAEPATGLRRGVEILFTLEGESADGGLGVTRIAELVGREKSQVSRSLKVLAQYGLVERDPRTRGYRLGSRLFALAGRSAEARLARAGAPLLARLVAELQETAHLSVLQGREVLTVLSDAPHHAVRAADWVGRTVPAYCTSSGRALLFDRRRSDLEALFRGVRFDRSRPGGPRTAAELFDRVQADREAGFSVVRDEFEEGLVAVAAPVRDPRGLVAALNVSGPAFRFGGRADDAAAAVKEAADELSARLGAPRGVE